MSNVYSPGTNNLQAQPVILAPVASNYFNQMSSEPQMMMMRQPNSAYLYTSSVDVGNRDEPPVDSIVRSGNDATLVQKVNKMGLTFMRFQAATTVINSSNDMILIWVESTNTIYTLNIAHGNWNTPQKLMTEFHKALIGATPGPPPGAASVRYYFNQNVGTPTFITPTANNEVTINFNFNCILLSQSNGIFRGRSTFAFPIIQIDDQWNGVNPVNQITKTPKPSGGFYTLTEVYTELSYSSITCVGMPCRYSRYIDVFSPTLTSYTKLPSATTKSGSNSLLYRLYLDVFSDYASAIPDEGILLNSLAGVDTPIIYQPENNQFIGGTDVPVTFTRNVDESISTIDFRIRDEYGNVFLGKPANVYKFVNPLIPDKDTIKKTQVPDIFTHGINWDMAFYCEI